MKTQSVFPFAARLAVALVAACLALSIGTALAQGKKGPKAEGQGKAAPQPPPDPALFVPFIDTHAHLDFTRFIDYGAALNALIARMDDFGIEKTILMPTPQGGIVGQKSAHDLAQLLPAMQKYPERVMVMAGPGVLGELYFQKAAEAITSTDREVFRDKTETLARGPISGFGEFGIVHLSLPQMGPMHPYESVPADHPLLLLLSDIAAQNGLPIDIHFDLVPRDMDLPGYLVNSGATHPNPSRLRQNRDGLERFLAHNRKTKIVWAHVGGEPLATRTPPIVRDLLMRNANLYMSFRLQHARPDFAADALTPQGQLKSDWRQLILDFPERFVLGTDTFYQDSSQARGGNATGLENLRRLLSQLPPDIAHKVARDNAAGLYRQIDPAHVPTLSPSESLPKSPVAAKKAKGGT